MSVSQVGCTFFSICAAILLIFVPFPPPLQCREKSNFQWQTWFLWHCNGGGKGVRKLAKLRGGALSNCSFSRGPDVDPLGQIYGANWKKCTVHLRHGHQFLIKKKWHFADSGQDAAEIFPKTRGKLDRFFSIFFQIWISKLFVRTFAVSGSKLRGARLEYSRGGANVWKSGDVNQNPVWMSGSLEVWMSGCLEAWMPGCLDVWMSGCLMNEWRLARK